MRYKLLTTTVLVGFAGTATAQESGVSFTGDAEFGYTNDSSVNNNSADNTRLFF